MPVLLVFIGGAIGGALGAIGFMLNIRVFRSSMNRFLKYILTAVVTMLAIVIYIVGAIILHVILQAVWPR